MLNLIRRLASRLSHPVFDEEERQVVSKGMLAQTLRCELAYYDNILRVHPLARH